MATSEEDFWNSSNCSRFSFDDDFEMLCSSFEELFYEPKEEYCQLPIQAIISKHSLDLLLLDVKSVLPPMVPSIIQTLKKLANGQKSDLTVYTKFQDKMKLLDEALNTSDANVILRVIIFLKRTLRRNIFYHQLSKRKIAVKHYGHYLMLRNKFEQLTDLYMATGNCANMKQIFYLIGQGVSNKETLFKKQEQFLRQHLITPNSHEDKFEIQDNLQLLQYQISEKQNTNSLIEQLAELCKTELANQQHINKVQEFKAKFKIDDFTFEWTLLNVLCHMKLWMCIDDSFIKINWWTKKAGLKTTLNATLFFDALERHQAPQEALEHYLFYITDNEKALTLAQKYKCYKYIIRYHVQRKDRAALLRFKQNILPNTAEYFLLENSLKSLEKKGKT